MIKATEDKVTINNHTMLGRDIKQLKTTLKLTLNQSGLNKSINAVTRMNIFLDNLREFQNGMDNDAHREHGVEANRLYYPQGEEI